MAMEYLIRQKIQNELTDSELQAWGKATLLGLYTFPLTLVGCDIAAKGVGLTYTTVGPNLGRRNSQMSEDISTMHL